ncbi:MAG TPA: PTS sugar transporter subunit IIA [Gammaproteobacteria bacterium]|nr:PTS sugar transporter subunit IIA [Gammaproteobacteria bacterium]|tara:strand:- start:397 stop:846 length:450 start_codon:yes stop_codon:yes gene_type:complete
MQIHDILSVERVAIGVDAASKKAVLEELARLVTFRSPDLTPVQAFDGLISRERLGSTGIGNGLAIPHGRIKHLTTAIGAFLRTESALDFDAIDGQPVDLFFALFVPEEATDTHLTMLASLAKTFSDERLVGRLRTLPTTQTVYSLLVTA